MHMSVTPLGKVYIPSHPVVCRLHRFFHHCPFLLSSLTLGQGLDRSLTGRQWQHQRRKTIRRMSRNISDKIVSRLKSHLPAQIPQWTTFVVVNPLCDYD